MTVEFSKLATLIHTINNDNKPWGASIIEVPTDIGRTWAGYKRGGVIEGAEKFRKEGMTAIVWLFGIPAFRWLGDRFCEKAFKIPMDIDFTNGDIKKGNNSIKDTVEFLTKNTKKEADEFLKEKSLKNGLEGFFDVSDLPKRYFKNGESIFKGRNAQNMLKTIKSAKIATSIAAFLLNIGMLGVVLPLVNQAMTRNKMKLMNKNKTKVSTLKTDNFEQFRNKTKNKSKKLAFTGLNGFFREPFANLTDLIENSNTFRLIGPDAPMIAGRIKTSRNKYEALENAVIDLSGVFLYNYCAGVVQKALRKPYKLPSIAPTLSEIIASKDENTIKNAVKKLNEANKTLSIEELFDSDTAKEIYKTATYGKYGKINKYVKKETLDEIDGEVCEFLKKFAQSGEKIANYTKKINNRNAIFMAIGFLVAIIGQAYLVPKIAFAITKKLTGKDEFSGIADYSDIKKEK